MFFLEFGVERKGGLATIVLYLVSLGSINRKSPKCIFSRLTPARKSIVASISYISKVAFGIRSCIYATKSPLPTEGSNICGTSNKDVSEEETFKRKENTFSFKMGLVVKYCAYFF